MIKENKRWLVTIDLDSTFLSSKNVINPYNIKIVKKVISMGHKVAIVTGRPWKDTEEIYHKIGLDTIISNFNGALISSPKDKGFIPTQTSINRSLLKELINQDLVKTATKNIIIEYGDFSSMLNPDDEDMKYMFHIEDKTLRKYEINSDIIKNPYSCTIQVDINKVNKMDFLFWLKSKYGNAFLFRYWEWPDRNIYNLEINQKAITKGSAMEYIAKYYNIPLHRTIAFGDGFNDIEMLSMAAIGVAMKNASNEIKRYADDTTKHTNVEAGVGKYLEDFFNIK